MGNSQSDLRYSIPISDKSDDPNCTITHRHPDYAKKLINPAAYKNCWELFQEGKKVAGDNSPLLGERQHIGTDTLGDYIWKSFKECESLALQVGSGLFHFNCCPEKTYKDESYIGAQQLRCIGILSKNCEEWVLLDLACQAYNLTSVPLYETLGIPAITHILKETEISCCVLKSESFDSVVEANSSISVLKHLIFIDKFSTTQKDVCKKYGIEGKTWEEVLAATKNKKKEKCPGTLQDVYTICYTSGTTGNPKGAIVTNANMVSVILGAKDGPMKDHVRCVIGTDDIHFSYLPLPHIFERTFCNLTIATGGRVGFYSGDILKLLDDISALRPTFFISVPRLYNRIHDKIFSGLTSKSSVVQFLFNRGLKTKLAKLKKTGDCTHSFWDTLVFGKTKALLGGRTKVLVVGGAPLDAEVQYLISVLFCTPLIEGYGLTETMGASFLMNPDDNLRGHCGGPVPTLEFKLRSVPEMQYLVTDNPPKGELLIRGSAVIPGYFQKSNDIFDSNGYFITGDVASLLPTGCIKIIDRRKNIFKLSQGEYIIPDRIEGVIQRAPFCAQAFVHGDSMQSAVVSVIVPDEEMAIAHFKGLGQDRKVDIKSLANDQEFTKLLLADVKKSIDSSDLKGFEKPRAFHVSNTLFSVENDLITPTFKLKRFNAKVYFQTEIKDMYASIG